MDSSSVKTVQINIVLLTRFLVVQTSMTLKNSKTQQ